MTHRPHSVPPAATPRKNWQWYRMDLHLHTPASADFKDRGITYLQWLQKAEAKGLDIIALTDHNSVAGWAGLYREVETLIALDKRGRLTEEEKNFLGEYRRLAEKILVLPGFEVTATLGFHVLGIFPMGTSVRRLEHILLDLNVPEDKLELGVGEVGSTSDVLTVYREIAENGGIAIAAHANSTHGVALQGFDFGGQTKIAYTQDKNLHALEVTDLESTSRRRTANFFDGSKPEYPRRLHCIQGSDAHRLDHDTRDKSEPWGIGDRVTEVYLPELSFDALKELFLGDDFARTRPARPWGGPVVQPAFDEVKAARKQGPNLVQSFHEHFSNKPGRLAAIVADVVAMANTNGGTVYVGVNANPKPPVVGVEKPEDAVALLKSELQKATMPPIGATLETIQTDGKPIIVVKVPKGAETPYVLGTGQIYVRQESETTLAMRDQIVRLVLSSYAPAAAARFAAVEAAEHAPVEAAAPVPAETPAPRPVPAPGPTVQPQIQQRRPQPQLPARPPMPAPQPRPVPARPVQPAIAPVAPGLPVPAVAVEPVRPAPVQQVVAAEAAAGAAQPVAEAKAAPKPRRRRPARPKAAAEAPVAAEPSEAQVVAEPSEAQVVAEPSEAVGVAEVAAPSRESAAVAPSMEPVQPVDTEKPKPRRRTRKPTPAAVAPEPKVEPQPEPEIPAPESPAVTVPAVVEAAPAPKRRRASRAKAPAVEQPQPAPVVQVEDEPTLEVPAAPDSLGPTLTAEPPRTGVEVLEVENRDGVLTYTVRDLRNNNVVHNVTRFSARHLWKYAIAEREDNPLDESLVVWVGRLGLWKTYKRAGARRFNLVQRDSEGSLHVYYGVTEDGIHGDWHVFLENGY